MAKNTKSVEEIVNPVFILGSPRSGTTLLYKILSKHNNFAYFTNFSLMKYYYKIGRKLSYLPGYTRFERFFLLRPRLTKRLSMLVGMKPWMVEGFSLWINEMKELNQEILTADDVSEEIASHFQGIMNKYCEVFDKERFLSKDPENSLRIGFFNEIFPKAHFIHIVRDPRAVVNSLMKFPLSGKPLDGYWLKFATQEEREEISKKPELSWAFRWRIMNEEIWKYRERLNDRYLEITYSEFTENQYEMLNKIFEFLDLDCSEDIQKFLSQNQIDNKNYKWRQNLNNSQINNINIFLKAYSDYFSD